MKTHKFLIVILLYLLATAVLSACTPSSNPSPVVAATAVPAPTATPTLVPTQVKAPSGFKLAWSDEFDESSINTNNWTYDIGGWGWGNGEMEYYTDRPENARIENGELIIEARQEKYEGNYYTSARLKTQGLQSFQYGRVEARLKVPPGKGLWPAFWMLGTEFNGNNWPDCGEIDIMEYIGKEPDLIMGTLHGPGYSGALGLSQWNRQKYNIADDYHIYAVEWNADQIDWFYDGVKYHTVTRADVGNRTWVGDRPYFVILNLAVGGQLPGMVGVDTVFPAQLKVDYVRYFQPIDR